MLDIKRTGVLLMNIGTPASSDVKSVQTYLDEFLTDPEVVPGPRFVRELIMKKWVIPRRSHASAKKYQSIWTDQGSPLMVESVRFCEQLQSKMGPKVCVKIGMRYGQPSIEQGLKEILEFQPERIILLPLFPQEAQATTGTCLKKARECLQKTNFQGEISEVKSFFNETFFIDSWKSKLQGLAETVDHWLFSFHGLPVSHIKKTPGCYANPDCCNRSIEEKKSCYRSQCYATARAMAASIQLEEKDWSISFQSRLGPMRWIEPFTDRELIRIAQNGKKRLAICAPAFVVDGL